MTKTPWNWIITAFILAVLFLVTLVFYRKQESVNNISGHGQIDELNAKISDKDKKIAELNKELNDLRGGESSSTYCQEIDSLKTEIDNKDGQIAELNIELKDLRNKNGKKSPPSSSSASQIKSLNEQIRTLRDEIDSKEQMIEKLRNEIQLLNTKLDYFKN